VLILVTGFEPNDDGLNASKILVESFRDQLPPSLSAVAHLLRYELMPASSDKLHAAALGAIQRHRADICLFVGQAPGRNKLTFERFATNLKDFNSPDGEGSQPRGEMIEASGPAAYRSNLPGQELLVERLNACEIPSAFSNHGGNHLCNQLLYHGLHYGAGAEGMPLCGFLHIPPLPVQALKQWPGTPFLPLGMAREALAMILIELVRYLPEDTLRPDAREPGRN
jgi:pyroglutamyl-peptidase